MVAFYRGVPSECKCCRTLGGFGGLICWQGRRAAAVTTQGRRDKDGCVHSHLANGFTKTTHCGFPGVRATQGLATSWVPFILISTFRCRALRAPSHSLLQAPVTALLYGWREADSTDHLVKVAQSWLHAQTPGRFLWMQHTSGAG